MEIKNVLVVGSGVMGTGIAQVCAQAGLEVILNDVNPIMIDQAIVNIKWSLGKLIEKGKISEPLETILNRIRTVIDLDSISHVDLVIEAIFENLSLKQEIFKKLDEIFEVETIFASNTSAIPITEIAAPTKRPERVLGLHFFNPVVMMDVVEVVRGVKTSEEVMNAGVNFVKRIGKEPIRVERDVAGFLLNRINLVGYVEAIRLLEQGIGTVEDIDKGVRLAFGRRMGPFETGDLVGLDVSCNALMAIYEDTKDIRFYPPDLLRRKVKAGELGKKSGKGWYRYNNGK